MKHSWKQELCCFETARSISDVDQVYELNKRPHAKDRKNTYARTNSVDFFRDGLETSIVGWCRQEEGPLLVAWQRPLLRTTGRIETCRPAGRGGSITPRTPAYCVGDHTCDKAGGDPLCGHSSLKLRRLRPSEPGCVRRRPDPFRPIPLSDQQPVRLDRPLFALYQRPPPPVRQLDETRRAAAIAGPVPDVRHIGAPRNGLIPESISRRAIAGLGSRHLMPADTMRVSHRRKGDKGNAD